MTRAAARDGDFTELFRRLGTSDAQRVIDADGGPAPAYTSVENTVVEAVHASRPWLHGEISLRQQAFVNKQLQRLLAKWAYLRSLSKRGVCASGGFLMPGSWNPRRGIHDGLADDGYLFLGEGETLWGSDWVRIRSGPTERSRRSPAGRDCWCVIRSG